jgi:hypothetical protein
VSARPVPPCQVRVGYILAYDGRELTVIGRYGTWYHEDGKPVAGLAIDCRPGTCASPPHRGQTKVKVNPERQVKCVCAAQSVAACSKLSWFT